MPSRPWLFLVDHNLAIYQPLVFHGLVYVNQSGDPVGTGFRENGTLIVHLVATEILTSQAYEKRKTTC